MKIPAILSLAVSIAITFIPADVKAATIPGWSDVIVGPIAKGRACSILQRSKDGTLMMIRVDTKAAKQHLMEVTLLNMSWSVKEGDDLGELVFLHKNRSTMVGTPLAGDHAILLYIPPGQLSEWVEDSSEERFVVMRGPSAIARVDAPGLAKAVAAVRMCARQEFGVGF